MQSTIQAERTYEELRKDAIDPDEVESSVSEDEGDHDCGPSGEEYRRIVGKAVAHYQDRSSRESEIEAALDRQIPGLLREVLREHGHSKRPALRDLNTRLDDAGKDRDVSQPTFYNWLDKYHLT